MLQNKSCAKSSLFSGAFGVFIFIGFIGVTVDPKAEKQDSNVQKSELSLNTTVRKDKSVEKFRKHSKIECRIMSRF